MTAAELAAALEQAVPGAVSAHEDAIDMPTLTVHRERLIETCLSLRDQHGKNFLSAVTAVDYLGYGEEVAATSAERPRHQPHGQLGHARDGDAAGHPLRGRLPPGAHREGPTDRVRLQG